MDIIFVHGLGGTCRLSWSWNRDLSLFWPKEWLPLEPELKEARILTFGYNAHFMSPNKDTFNVSDFAKELLMQMKFGNDADVKSLNIGKLPLIFVVHSMGGLVVKKAYILGSQDPQYQHILGNVCSIVFLATPHRGSSLADILNKFLFVSFHSPKQYINDLMRNSPRISDINDQFRIHADKMQIVSFFETQPTNVGLKRVIVVERDSASEISSPLNADHHTVCKYASRQDPNYISVRNVLKSLVEKFKVKGPRRRVSFDRHGAPSIQSLNETMSRLGIAERPTDDLDSSMESYVPGSCDWILTHETFTSFLDDQTARPSVLHVTGHPGAGKSMLASFLIHHLAEELERPVQFWYFRYDDQEKRSVRQCLLSLALQMANCIPEYFHWLTSMTSDIESITRIDNRSIWQKLFVNSLDKLGAVAGPVHWVIDAVDESESSQAFLGYLACLRQAKFPLRIVILTRPQTVTRHFDKVKASLPPGRTFQVEMAPPEASLEVYVTNELADSPWSDIVRTKITKSLLAKSQGNFLWLTLVINRLVDCDTVEELEEALEETPWELVEVYSRMEMALADALESKDLKGKHPEKDVRLLRTILAWVTCAERHITLEELTEALKPSFGDVFNLRRSINRLCGDFVVVDKKGRISLVHHTAKEYLTKSASSFLAMQPSTCHTLVFGRCLDILTDSRFRMRLKSQGCTGLLQYCCLSWSHHMVRSDASGHDKEFVYRLAGFFRDRASLAWIEAVATTGHVRALTSAAKDLTSYLERLDVDTNSMLQPLLEADLLGMWATELIRIVGKFGTHLVQYPSCIHSLVPLFCPPDSVIGRQFSVARNHLSPSITGISNTGWDDFLAKFSAGDGQRPKAVHSLDSSLAIVTSDKAVNLYHSATFQESSRFHHNEIILVAQFSREGDKLVTCGLKTIKVWDTMSARELDTFSNPKGVRSMAVTFSGDSTQIIICCMGSNVWRQRLSEPEEWIPIRWNDPGRVRTRGTPICTSFSPDGSQIAIASRKSAIASWGIENGNLIGRCERGGGVKKQRSGITGYPLRLTWNPVTEHVVGIYNDGTIFKWYPLDSEPQEMRESITAAEIACSPDGRLIVAGQRDGSLKIFSFDNFSLLYHLSSMSPVTALTVSADGRRIYDLRQSYCNVWEPNALIRTAEQDEKASDTSSSHCETSVALSSVSEASAVSLEPVSAVCADLVTGAFAFGNDAGVVTYVHPDGQTSLKFPCANMGTVSLAISDNGEYIAMASIDRTVAAHKLTSTWTSRPLTPTARPTATTFQPPYDRTTMPQHRTTTTSYDGTSNTPHSASACPPLLDTPSPDHIHVPGPPSHFRPQSPPPTEPSQTPILKTKSENILVQILFDSTASHLLGRCHGYINLWRLPNPIPVTTRPHDDEPCFWITHPFNPSYFLSIGRDAIVSYTTSALSPVTRWPIDFGKVELAGLDAAPTLSRRPPGAYPMSSSETETWVERVLVAPSKSIMLVESSRAASLRGRIDSQFFLLRTDFLLDSSSGLSSSSTSASSPADTPSHSCYLSQ